jgi:hypothetical protein
MVFTTHSSDWRGDCRESCMRILAVAAVLAFLNGVAQAAEESRLPEPKEYVEHAFDKSAFFWAGVGTVVGQIANSPREWGQGPDGAAKRFGAVFGKQTVKSSVQLTVASLRQEDLKYHPSEQSGFGARMKHALVSTVVARKTMDGSTTVATGRLAGAFSSGYVSELWLPDRLHTVTNGLASGGVSLGVNALTNTLREFVPLLRRRLQNR